MSHRYIALVCSSLFAAVTVAVGDDAKPQDKFTGVWKTNDTSRYEERWTIKFVDDAWEIKGVYTKDGREVGKAHGTKVKLGKESLAFTRVFDKKPASDLPDDATCSFRLTEKGGDMIFRGGGKQSIRKVTRDADAVAVKPDPKDKTDPKVDPAPKQDGPFKELAQVKVSKTLAGMTLALSPDGKQGAVISSRAGATTNTVAIWDLVEKKVVQRIRPEGLTDRLAWSADGKSLATLQLGLAGTKGKPKQLAIWNPETGEQRAALEAPQFAAGIAISADGSVVAAVQPGLSEDGVVKAWDVVNKKEIFSQDIQVSIVPVVGLSADGKTLMTHSKGDALLFDLATGKLKATIKGSPQYVILSADGKLVVAASYDAKGGSQLHIWDTANPAKPLKTVPAGKGRVDHLALVDNNRHVIVSGSSDEVHDIELASGKIVHSFAPAKGLLTVTLTTTPDSAHLFTLSGDYVARLWSTPYGPKR